MLYWFSFVVTFFAGLGLGLAYLVLLRRWRLSTRWRKLAEGIGIAFLTFFLTFMAAEVFFKVVFAQTENRNFTLASRNWFERYWILNSRGYRDVEWSEVDLQNKRKILISGDSFAAGQGIENIEDRFSNILGHKLGNDYLVMNIAQPGFSTKEEIDRLRGFHYKPEILIHQYYLNDIRHAAERKDMVFNPPDTDPWPIFAPLVENSYALNFIYWRATLLGPRDWQGDSMAWLQMVYSNPDVWWIHQQELLALHQGAASEDVKLVVVIFPILTDLNGSRAMTTQVVEWFEEKGVSVLDVAELVKDEPTDRLVVSSLDSHPSEWLHARVADALYEMILQIDRPQVVNE